MAQEDRYLHFLQYEHEPEHLTLNRLSQSMRCRVRITLFAQKF
jgi:hypothetical protein